MIRRKDVWLWAGILAIAIILRLWALDRKSLWLDEIMSVQKAALSFSGMMEQIRGHDAHPPLFQIVQWLWMRLGRGDGFARVPMALAGVIGVGVAMLLARRLFGRMAAWIAGALMAVSCFHVFYSQEARLHALVTTLVLVQAVVLLRLLAARGKAHWGWWTAYGAAALACLYTYALCILTIAAFALAYLVAARRGRRQTAAFIAVHVIVGALFLPWYPTLRRTTARVEASVEALGDDLGRPGSSDILTGVAGWAFGPQHWERLRAGGGLLGATILAVAAVGLGFRRARRPVRFLCIAFFVPLIGYFMLPMPRVHAYDPKHLIFLQPLLIIALAGIRAPSAWKRGPPAKLALCAACALGVLNLWMLHDYYAPEYQKENWRALVAEVAPQVTGEDGILFNPLYVGFAFEHYLPSEAARADIHRRAELTAEGRPVGRIWFIECTSPVARPDPRIAVSVASAGWRPQEEKSYPGEIGALTWTRLVRPSDAAQGPPQP